MKFSQLFHVHWMTFSGTQRQEAVQQQFTSRPHGDVADLQTFCFCRSSIATDFFSTNRWNAPITAKNLIMMKIPCTSDRYNKFTYVSNSAVSWLILLKINNLFQVALFPKKCFWNIVSCLFLLHFFVSTHITLKKITSWDLFVQIQISLFSSYVNTTSLIGSLMFFPWLSYVVISSDLTPTEVCFRTTNKQARKAWYLCVIMNSKPVWEFLDSTRISYV